MGRSHRHDGDNVHYHHRHHHDHDHHHGHNHHHGYDHVHLVDSDDTSHGDHSGYETGVERVTILGDISSEDDRRTEHNRELLTDHGMEAINLMSSPGSGKTALLEKTLAAAQSKLRVDIIGDDIEAALDANRPEGYGVQISLLNAGNGFGGKCYLDTPMVSRALEGLDPSALDLVMAENVGNLVRPVEFEVSETRKAIVYSLTEGEDKPARYPVMSCFVQAVAINKIDLAPYLDFDTGLFHTSLEKTNSGVEVIEVSAKTGEGTDKWLR